VAHGGLVAYGHKKSGGPRAFHSTRTVGSLRYVFFSRLNWIERLELRLAHPKFYGWCREQTHKAMDEPLSAKECLMLGLMAEDSPE